MYIYWLHNILWFVNQLSSVLASARELLKLNNILQLGQFSKTYPLPSLVTNAYWLLDS